MVPHWTVLCGMLAAVCQEMISALQTIPRDVCFWASGPVKRGGERGGGNGEREMEESGYVLKKGKDCEKLEVIEVIHHVYTSQSARFKVSYLEFSNESKCKGGLIGSDGCLNHRKTKHLSLSPAPSKPNQIIAQREKD